MPPMLLLVAVLPVMLLLSESCREMPSSLSLAMLPVMLLLCEFT